MLSGNICKQISSDLSSHCKPQFVCIVPIDATKVQEQCLGLSQENSFTQCGVSVPNLCSHIPPSAQVREKQTSRQVNIKEQVK